MKTSLVKVKKLHHIWCLTQCLCFYQGVSGNSQITAVGLFVRICLEKKIQEKEKKKY